MPTQSEKSVTSEQTKKYEIWNADEPIKMQSINLGRVAFRPISPLLGASVKNPRRFRFTKYMRVIYLYVHTHNITIVVDQIKDLLGSALSIVSRFTSSFRNSRSCRGLLIIPFFFFENRITGAHIYWKNMHGKNHHFVFTALSFSFITSQWVFFFFFDNTRAMSKDPIDLEFIYMTIKFGW